MHTGPWYLGIDWGNTTHAYCLLDAAGGRVAQGAVAHTGEGLAALVALVRQHTGDALPAVHAALERPTGPVVAALCAAGIAVAHINPKQLARFRERATAAGAKDDARDAYTAASARRTDPDAFHPITLPDAALVTLRQLTQIERDLAASREQGAQRLRTLLQDTQPTRLALCPAADAPWFWALCALAPTPAAGAALRPHRVATLLRAHRIRRVTAETVVAALRAPALPLAPGVAAAQALHLGYLVPQLQLLQTQHAACTKALTAAVAALDLPPDDPTRPSLVATLDSLPGVGLRVQSTLLAEAQAHLVPTGEAILRAYTGVAPVTDQSGKRRTVRMRHACNQHLRNAMYWWAARSIALDAGARACYARARARGHGHARALRTVADRWLRILYALLRTGTRYLPNPLRPPTPAAELLAA
jgi:hypothetical protein